MVSQAYPVLDKEWRSTCRAVLGGEVGPLSGFGRWLSGLNDPLALRKSESGENVVMTSPYYCAGARAISQKNADFMRKFAPLSINEMKDIDSLLDAVSQRASYCGGIVIGNSGFIEKSSSVSDSFFVSDSVRVSGCKNVAHSQWMRLSENIFGTNEGGSSRFCIRCCVVFGNQRSFELWISGNTSDSYYSYGLEDCRDCIFSFNLIGKSHCIGNLQLEKSKYAAIKSKLLAEIRQELEKNKGLPSLVDIIGREKPDYSAALAAVKGLKPSPRDNDKSRLEEAFASASSVVLGERLSGIDKHAAWLSRHSIIPRDSKSVLGMAKLQVSDYPGMKLLPANRLVTQEEASLLGERLHAPAALAESASLENAGEILGSIAYFPPERRIGTYKNLVACQWGSQSSDCYRTVVCAHCKYCGFNAWPRSSENCYGCGIVYDSQFCFKCHDSVNLKRCLEVDSGRECSDTWFSHNVEAMQNCLFCFNTKSKRYAVGNAEVGKETFEKTKGIVREWLVSELKSGKTPKLSVFNMACAGKQ
ncbi:MAG: hypothetical protein WC506_02250 [Candidatus Micrarchaeia archaeon]